MENLVPPSAAAVVPVVAELRPHAKRQQLFRELMNDGEMLLKNRLEVRHLMTRSPLVVSSSTSLEEMSELMRKLHIRHLLVGGNSGELLGVVSDRDLHAQRGSTAHQLMSFPPLTCTPDTPLGAAITFMQSNNISCLPVVEHGRICGIMTTTDLVLMLQCTLQSWLRLAQVLQQDTAWPQQLQQLADSLSEDLTAGQLAERIQAARRMMHQEIENLVNAVDLRADALTGMSNRRELEEILGLMLGVKKRYQRPFSLAIVIVDHYQRILETCGEDVARQLLKSVGRLIEQTVRESDFAARYSEHTFAVILTETSQQQASLFCQRLLDAAQQRSQVDVPLRLKISAVEATEAEDVGHLLARAQVAMP